MAFLSDSFKRRPPCRPQSGERVPTLAPSLAPRKPTSLRGHLPAKSPQRSRLAGPLGGASRLRQCSPLTSVSSGSRSRDADHLLIHEPDSSDSEGAIVVCGTLNVQDDQTVQI